MVWKLKTFKMYINKNNTFSKNLEKLAKLMSIFLNKIISSDPLN